MTTAREESKGLRLLGHTDLAGNGNCGEGLALQQARDGRRVLWVAHEGGGVDVTAVDVTDPREPHVIYQSRLPHGEVRSNSLALVGDLLLVARQVARAGLTPAGVALFDVARPEAPRLVGFFDTSGRASRGVHCLWFVDGEYAHLATGAPDFTPSHPRDDQFYMIVDVRDPARPAEVGRWWYPGTRQGDEAPPPKRHTTMDNGYRVHNTNVYPQRPDRAYLGYLDAGVVVLDIADKARPRLVSQLDYHPPFNGFTHTVLPLFGRGLLVVSEESVREHAEDWPKVVWLMDAREETNIVPVSVLPMPPREEYAPRPGRFGAHNVHENEPLPTSWTSETHVVCAMFNAGVRVYDVRDPFRPEEVASYVPPAPPGAPGVNINDVYVDERGLVYAAERGTGGVYILEMTL